MKLGQLAGYAAAFAVSWMLVLSFPADSMAGRMAKNFNAGTEKAPAGAGMGQAAPSAAEPRPSSAPAPGSDAPVQQRAVIAPPPPPVQAAPPAPVPPSQALTPERTAFPEKLTEELHQKFLAEDEDYALADALLNLTWKNLKRKVDKGRYKEILQSQRTWVASERDTGARANARDLPPAKAYAAEILRRANALAQHISSPPATGEYESPEAFLALQTAGGRVQVMGDAGNARGHTCSFEGTGDYAPGWIRMRHEDMPDFLLLPMGNELLIHYTSSGSAQGCGLDVDFKGSYIRKK